MEQTSINVRTEYSTKKQAEQIFNDLGMNMSTAINIFLRKVISSNGIPFDLTIDIPNKDTLEAIKEGKEMSKNLKKYKKYSSFSELLKDIK